MSRVSRVIITDIHELKVLPVYFKELINGNKTFEIRKNDRDYKVADKLILREYYDGAYTGHTIHKIITCIFWGGQYGLDKDYVILGIR